MGEVRWGGVEQERLRDLIGPYWGTELGWSIEFFNLCYGACCWIWRLSFSQEVRSLP